MFLNFALYKERSGGISFHLGASMSEVVHGVGWGRTGAKIQGLGQAEFGSDSVD